MLKGNSSIEGLIALITIIDSNASVEPFVVNVLDYQSSVLLHDAVAAGIQIYLLQSAESVR